MNNAFPTPNIAPKPPRTPGRIALVAGFLVLGLAAASIIALYRFGARGGITVAIWVGLLPALLLVAVLVGPTMRRWIQAHRPDLPASRCAKCGYDLTGIALPRCPECGCAVGFDRSFADMGVSEEELQALSKKRSSPTDGGDVPVAGDRQPDR